MASRDTMIEMSGDIGLMWALNHMRAASARKIMRPAISQGLTIANRAAKKLAPKLGGELRKSIKKKTGRSRKGGVSGKLFISAKNASNRKQLMQKAYAHEFGTKTMAARPYMRPSIERMSPVFRERMEAALVKVAK